MSKYKLSIYQNQVNSIIIAIKIIYLIKSNNLYEKLKMTNAVKLSVLFVSIALAGCSNNPANFSGMWNDSGVKTDAAAQSRTQSMMKSGAEYLVNGEYDKAQKVFNTALKFDLKSAPLHFFNALTYQMRYEKGDADSYPLAEAGYRAAIDLDPTMDLAHLQLGRLYMAGKNYTGAKNSFAMAVDAKPKAPQEAMYGLAQASLFSGDIDTSLWATTQLENLKWKDARLFRIKAFHAAMANKPKIASEMLAQYSALEENKQEVRYLGNRIDQLMALKTSLNADRGNGNIILAQADAAKSDSKEPAKEDKKAEADGSERKNWFRCDLRPGPVMEKDVVNMNTPLVQAASEETIAAPTLPAPCAGEEPPVAVIEVTMIRTEEAVQKSYGINLIDGLSMASKVTRGTDGVFTKTAANIFNTGDGTAYDGGWLSYSLNIANSLYTKNEVVARPTLAAIDRLPSIFFSGTTYSIKVGGVNTSTIVDKPVGISLAVTPTFVGNDQVLLSIRASRSFIEESSNANVALVQTRNSVNGTALVNYGQTFVLNGLVEREKDISRSGVPVLEDIPILQYFFNKSVSLDYNRQILTLVTVRKLVDSDESIASAKSKNKQGLVSAHKLSSQVQAFTELQKNMPVLDEVIQGLHNDNSLYTRLRQRDLIQEPYGSKSLLKKIVHDFTELLYY